MGSFWSLTCKLNLGEWKGKGSKGAKSILANGDQMWPSRACGWIDPRTRLRSSHHHVPHCECATQPHHPVVAVVVVVVVSGLLTTCHILATTLTHTRVVADLVKVVHYPVPKTHSQKCAQPLWRLVHGAPSTGSGAPTLHKHITPSQTSSSHCSHTLELDRLEWNLRTSSIEVRVHPGCW